MLVNISAESEVGTSLLYLHFPPTNLQSILMVKHLLVSRQQLLLPDQYKDVRQNVLSDLLPLARLPIVVRIRQ